MNNRPVQFRGKTYPVLKKFRIGGRLYLAIKQLGTAGRESFQVFDPSAREFRVLHILANQDGMLQQVRTTQRLTRGDNEILQIIECQQQGDQVFVVLPWIDGFSLQTIMTGIRDRGRLRIAAPEAVRLMKGVAHALGHLHQRKDIVHVDIKPANLILTNRKRLILIDYGNAWQVGLSKLRGGGDGLSQIYASPEMNGGNPDVTFRTDYFSVGVILYELLTSKIPFDGHGGKVGTLPQRAREKLRLIPVSQISPEREKIPRSIWREVDRLIARCLGIEPSQRFGTTSEWLDAWSNAMFAINQTRHPRPESVVDKLRRWLT